MNQPGPVTWTGQARAENANAACSRGGAATTETNVDTSNTPNGRAGSSIYTQRHLDAISAETIMVTPEMASTLRSDCHFERQRPISDVNVKRLALEMQRGWFIPGTPIYLCVLPDGVMQIVNGNHTLEAVRLSGVSLPLTFVYAKVPDAEAVSRVYANMDLQKVRSWQNSLQALKGDATNFEGKMLSAVGIIMSGFAGSMSSRDSISTSRTARFEAFEEYKKAGAIIHSAMLGGAPRSTIRFVSRAAVLAVALMTARYQPSAASEFWGGLLADDGLSIGDPRKALLRYMTENSAGAGSKERLDLIKASAAAWNAAWQKREVKYLKPGLATEVKILGTAWHNGEPAKAAAKKTRFETGMIHSSDGTVHQVARFAG